MLQVVCRNTSDRKLRLFAAACCRRVWELFPNETCRKAVEAAERVADGHATPQELAKLARLLRRQFFASGSKLSGQRARWIAWFLASEPWNPLGVMCGTTELLGRSAAPGTKLSARREECARQCDSLREIFGNPFRPVAFDPAWRTSDVMALATGIYESRDFTPTPILADALQDAGCDCDDLLNHCRGPQATHVRGCWALDLVLGKE
jgi:hypothetical protein